MKAFMTYVTENWALILTFVLVVIYLIQKIVEFVSLPTVKKLAQLKVLLLEWVRSAEAALGSKTGKFKFAQVYGKFKGVFPYLVKWISLEKFEVLVKEALKEMENSFDNKTTKLNALKEYTMLTGELLKTDEIK